MDSRGTAAMARSGGLSGGVKPPQQSGAFFMYMGLPSADVLGSIAQNTVRTTPVSTTHTRISTAPSWWQHAELWVAATAHM